jgi:xylulokinase
MATLCIDAGTTLIKVVLIDDEGREIAVVRRGVPVLRPRERDSEQDMEAVWQAVVEACRTMTQQHSIEIDCIATTAQGDGCWMVDGGGQPVGPAILWNDGRAEDVVERWRHKGVIEAAFRISGSVTYPGLANAVWRWLKTHDDERLRSARYLLSCNGWLYSRFTGEMAAELSDASNPFSDIIAREYSPELLRLFEAEEEAHLLPPISRGNANVAALRGKVAEALGVRAGIPVVMAPYDIVSTAIGCGCTTAGKACVILGTTICPEVVTAEAGREGSPAGTTIALDHDDLYLRAMPTLTGCEAVDWAASRLLADDLDHLSRMAEASVAGAHGIFCLPYLSPAGERSPFLEPSARGSFHGLSFSHTREDLARAVFEGLSFVVRDCLTAATPTPLETVALCGGGSKSKLWRQLIADICGCRVVRPSSSELGARGVFFTALEATGKVRSLQEAVEQFGVEGQEYQPELERSSTYQSLFGTFLELREAAASTWHGHKG